MDKLYTRWYAKYLLIRGTDVWNDEEILPFDDTTNGRFVAVSGYFMWRIEIKSKKKHY